MKVGQLADGGALRHSLYADVPRCPPGGGHPIMCASVPRTGAGAAQEEEDEMKVARRIVIALGTLMAIALAGGAHWKA